MPINIHANQPIAVIALQTALFTVAGLDSSNIRIIYRVGNPPKAWDPSRSINPINGFVDGDTYYIISKVDLDLTAFVAPPIPSEVEEIENWVLNNFSQLHHLHAASDVTTGVFAPARMGTGTADASKVLFGDGTWKVLPESTSLHLVGSFVVGDAGAPMAGGATTFTDTFIMGATANKLWVVVDGFDLMPNLSDALSFTKVPDDDFITFNSGLAAGTTVKVFFWI